MASSGKPLVISDRLIAEICDRLTRNQPVRRTLPDGGQLHIDRQLPFLIMYRPPEKSDDAGTKRFVTGEASYLVAPRRRRHRQKLSDLVSAVASTMAEVFGGFLIIELWSGRDDDAAPAPDGTPRPPGFRVVTARRDAATPSVARLMNQLRRVEILGVSAETELSPGSPLSPRGMPRISRSFGTAKSDVRLIGVEIRPIYRDADTGDCLLYTSDAADDLT